MSETAPARRAGGFRARARSRAVAVATTRSALILAILAEGAWITVLGNLVGLLAHAPAPPFPLLAALVGLGVAGRRLTAMLAGPPRNLASIALVAAGALVAGRLSGPLGSDAMLAGGLVGGLAVARGLRYAEQPLDEDGLRNLLGVGTAVIVLATLGADLAGRVGAAAVPGDPLSGLWLGATFAIGAILALAITREQLAEEQASVGSSASPDWLRTALLVVLLATAVGIPASELLATVIQLTVVALLLIWLVAGLLFGWTPRAVAIVIFGPIVVLAIGFLLSLLHGLLPAGGPLGGVVTPQAPQPLPPPTQPLPPELVGAIFLGLGGLAVVAFLLFAGGRVRRREASLRGGAEVRVIDHSGDAPGFDIVRWVRTATRLRPRPRNAEEAYRALVQDLAGRPGVERAASETPFEHAHRLRGEGAGSLSLDLLVADYAIARFGGGPLSDREQRRAVRRWHALRDRLRAVGDAARREAAERALASGGAEEETAEESEAETQLPSRSLRT